MKIPELPEMNPLRVSRATQYRTVEELLEKSRPSFNYYALLILSSIIITAGLLLGNTAIVIGGMLVTPLLTPLLAVALGVAVGESALIARVSRFMLQSFAYVVLGGLILTLIFGAPGVGSLPLITNSLTAGWLYFIIALASGVAATFAWIQKEVSEALPGVAIAVSLVPPLALIGIGFGSLNTKLAGDAFVIFLFNLVGIVIGSLVVFSLSKFNRSESKIKEINEEVVVETHLKKLEKDLKKEVHKEEINQKVNEKNHEE